MVPLSTPHWGLFLLGLTIACVFDVRSRHVPNWLTVGMLCAGLVARLVQAGLMGLGMGLLGAACGLGLLIIPFAKKWVGGGDVKLLIAMGGWLGPLALLQAALAATAAGGILALIFLLRSSRRLRQDVLTNLRALLYTRSLPTVEDRPLIESPPYALALAAGALSALYYNRGDFGLV